MFFGFARSNSSAHKLLNLTRAHMSSWRCPFVVVLFCLGFRGFCLLVLCAVSLLPGGRHHIWTCWTVYWSMLSFDTPMREMQDFAQFFQMAQTLCYDLARAEKATDGKKKATDRDFRKRREGQRQQAVPKQAPEKGNKITDGEEGNGTRREEHKYHSNGIQQEYWISEENPKMQSDHAPSVNRITLVERARNPTQGQEPLVPRDKEESGNEGP